MLDWSPSKWMLMLGILGAVYVVYLLIFRRDWPERRKDVRRWRSERRDDSSDSFEEVDANRREPMERRKEDDRREPD